MDMRKSRVLSKLRNGEIVTCVKLNTMDPRVAELAAMSGFDCLWYCLEHVATDWMTIENVIRAAKIYDVDVMVRVAKGSYSDFVRPLELDAAGIMVPHIMSFQEAQEVVRTTRFHPLGRRPVDGGNQDGAYCRISLTDYMEQANRERFVCVQIEDPEVLDDLDRIAALEGIDMILFGPGDFSQGIGTPGKMDNPKIEKTRRRIAEICVKHGKFAATPGGPEVARKYTEMGYRFLSIGADVIGLGEYFDRIRSDFERNLG